MDAMNRAATNYAVMATIDFRGLSRIMGWAERGDIHRSKRLAFLAGIIQA
jgi:hypothetical protein